MKLKKLLTCFFYLGIHMKKRNQILTLIPIFFVLSLIGCQTSENSSKEQTVIRETEIVFGTVDGVDLKLDLARPGKGKGPYPALVFIHGGGWRSGGRWNNTSYIREAAGRGYVAVTVDYRLTSVSDGPKAKYPFPAQIHDVKCAVRWLRANAEKYNVDPARIGAYGYSAGGHLALLLGLTDSSDGLEGNCGNLNFSSKVQAVVSRSGSTDLLGLFETEYADRSAVMRLVGGSPEEMPEEYRIASPVRVQDIGNTFPNGRVTLWRCPHAMEGEKYYGFERRIYYQSTKGTTKF